MEQSESYASGKKYGLFSFKNETKQCVLIPFLCYYTARIYTNTYTPLHWMKPLLSMIDWLELDHNGFPSANIGKTQAKN